MLEVLRARCRCTAAELLLSLLIMSCLEAKKKTLGQNFWAGRQPALIIGIFLCSCCHLFNLKEKNTHHKLMYPKGHPPAHRREEGHARHWASDRSISCRWGSLVSPITCPLSSSHSITQQHDEILSPVMLILTPQREGLS